MVPKLDWVLEAFGDKTKTQMPGHYISGSEGTWVFVIFKKLHGGYLWFENTDVD